MQVKLTHGEQARVWAKGTDNLKAYLKGFHPRRTCSTSRAENRGERRSAKNRYLWMETNLGSLYSFYHRFDLLPPGRHLAFTFECQVWVGYRVAEGNSNRLISEK